MYKRILLAVDGSDNALRAAKEAAKLVSSQEACYLEVLYVVDSKTMKSDVLQAYDKHELEVRRRQLLKPVTDILTENDMNYEVKVLHGEAAQTIVEHANIGEFEMAILGSRGLNALQEMVLGSVSNRAIKQIKCPVLIVK